MIWIWINYMKDTNESVDNTVEIDFKPFSIVYQSTLKFFND